jgi:hypothetical protein
MPEITLDDVLNFWAKVRKGPDCWEWTAGCNKNGYGVYNLLGKKGSQLAHRLAFAIHHRRWPKGNVLHTCDNPPCVRPTHLVEGDQGRNMNEAKVRGRVPRGEDQSMSRLTEADIHAIRGREGKATQAEIAEEFGVAQPTISKILLRKRWAHV